MEETVEAPPTTRQRTKSKDVTTILSVSAVPTTDERLVIHPHPLFGTMIPFSKDARLPSKTNASLLSNLMYNLKFACSIIPVPDRQFIIRRNMAINLTELIDLNMKVNIIIVCSLMLICFHSNFLAVFSNDCLSGWCCRSS